MKILMLTPYLPYPPSSGGQIRTYNLLKHLRQKHEVTLVCLYKKEAEKAHLEDLKDLCSEIYLCKRAEKPWQLGNILRAVFGKWPFLVVRNYSTEAAAKVSELLQQKHFDVIHAETFYIMPHIPKTTVPIVLVEQTIEYRVYKHYISSLNFILANLLRIDTWKLKVWEVFYWRAATKVVTVSEYDREVAEFLEPNINPIVIPNGAGDEMFASSVDIKKKHNKEGSKLLFVGNFSWLQNTEAALYLLDQVHPKLVKDLPSAKLIIAGQNIPEAIISRSSSTVEVIDIPPQDHTTIKKLYQEASVFIAPIFGPGGTRLKILAAMAAGVPVVTTKVGVEGLNLDSDEQILVADSPSEFVVKIKNIVQDLDLAQRLREGAYEHVKKHFSWASITAQLETVYSEIVGRQKKV